MGLILPAEYSLRILLKLVQIGHLESFLPFPICTEENLFSKFSGYFWQPYCFLPALSLLYAKVVGFFPALASKYLP